TSVVVLKPGIALLAWLVCLAVLIEPLDSEPGPIRRCLTGLRVEASSERIFFSKLSAIALQIVLADTMLIHPQAQALVPNELHDADGLINGGVLCFCTV